SLLVPFLVCSPQQPCVLFWRRQCNSRLSTWVRLHLPVPIGPVGSGCSTFSCSVLGRAELRPNSSSCVNSKQAVSITVRYGTGGDFPPAKGGGGAGLACHRWCLGMPPWERLRIEALPRRLLARARERRYSAGEYRNTRKPCVVWVS